MIELEKIMSDVAKGFRNIAEGLMKVDFIESLKLAQESENEETKKVLCNLALKQFARAVEKVKQEEKTGPHLHFKETKERLTIETGSVVGDSIYVNAKNTGIKTTYQIKGSELVVQLDGEEITLTEEKVRGFIEREKEIMKRIATGNYLEKF